jgi:hypothetical protein
MGRASAPVGALAVSSLVALAVASGACTVMSGVEELELRTGASATAPAADEDAGPDAKAPTTFNGNGTSGGSGTSGSGGGSSTSGSGGASGTGPATCGSLGSWSTCNAMPTVTTCAAECANKGQLCVESCCVKDAADVYAAKVGVAYAYPSECGLPSLPKDIGTGLCSDPLPPIDGTGLELRCCCK